MWGGFPRAEPSRIFYSFLNAEMLSNIAWFLQTLLCNVYLICIYNTALQQVTITQTKPGNISVPISLSRFPFSLILQEPKNLFFLKIFFFSIATSNHWNFSRRWGDCIWAQLSALSLCKWLLVAASDHLLCTTVCTKLYLYEIWQRGPHLSLSDFNMFFSY